MILNIKSSDTIQEIQQNFQKIFSHLRPEFYKNSHAHHEGNARNEQYLHNVQIGTITGTMEDFEIKIENNMTTMEFESMLEKQWNLHVQIFRKQRGTWLQTTQSDALSLESQNQLGVEADMDIKQEGPADLDLI